jgi:hypothetical protein
MSSLWMLISVLHVDEVTPFLHTSSIQPPELLCRRWVWVSRIHQLSHITQSHGSVRVSSHQSVWVHCWNAVLSGSVLSVTMNISLGAFGKLSLACVLGSPRCFGIPFILFLWSLVVSDRVGRVVIPWPYHRAVAFWLHLLWFSFFSWIV